MLVSPVCREHTPVPFTAHLPRLSPTAWEQIDQALTCLDACMEARPRSTVRVEDDGAYLGRLAAALKQAGSSIQAARLKNDVIDPRSWPTESQAESWARAFLRQGFDPDVDTVKLRAWLAQVNGEGDRPG